MDYFKNAKDLIIHSKETFKKINQSYFESLHDKEIKSSLLIDIKNFMENLRSALDYSAHGLYDRYGDRTRATDKIYFPYAWLGLSQTDFNSKQIIDKKIPGLPTNRPDIAVKIESYQHFVSVENSWFPIFMELNNENKHQQLTPQIKKEIKELRITSGNVGIRLVGNAGLKMTRNSSIRIGNAAIHGNQTVTPNNPAIISGDSKQEIITWISFHFSTNNENVIPFLNKALSRVEKIVNELSSL